MMACMAATLLALLLNYLASSEGALSPPINLSVELLDFKALARWLPGPGNPKGTRYFLEFIDIVHFSVSPWSRAGNCTNITSTQCYLILNQRIMTEYFVKVMAEWKDERSGWTKLRQSFQPYAYTLLSAPNLSVSAEHRSLWILLSHPVQSLTDVQMKFSVDLFSVSSNSTETKHIAKNITTRSSRFVDLPSGMYCVNASAFLTASSRCSNNASTCVFLHQDQRERKVWVVNVGVLLLMSIPAVIGSIVLYRYVRPLNIGYIPKALCIMERTGMDPTLNFRTLSFSRMCTDEATRQEASEDSSQGYYGDEARNGDGHGPLDGLLSQRVDEADQNEAPVWAPYGTAATMEESEECSTQTEHRADGVTPSASFLDTSAMYGQNTEHGNAFALEPDALDEENCWPSCDSSEQEDSGEGEMDSQHSDDVFESHYEPRPDPCWMLGGQFRSQH